MSTQGTIPEQDLPWRRARSTSESTALHLVICWALEEPERVGEVAAVTASSIVGRGGLWKERDRDDNEQDRWRHPRARRATKAPSSTKHGAYSIA